MYLNFNEKSGPPYDYVDMKHKARVIYKINQLNKTIPFNLGVGFHSEAGVVILCDDDRLPKLKNKKGIMYINDPKTRTLLLPKVVTSPEANEIFLETQNTDETALKHWNAGVAKLKLQAFSVN